MKRKHGIQLVIGICVSAVALYFVFKDASPREIFASLKSFRYVWLLPCLIVFYFGLWLRGLRWQWLFRPRYRVSLKNTTGGIFICFAFNSVFPARVGEFARAFLIGKQEKTGFSAAFGTVVAERLIDLITLLLMWIGAFWFAGATLIGPDAQLTLSLFGMEEKTFTGEDFLRGARGLILPAIALIAGIACIGIPKTRNGMLRLLRAMRFVPATIREKIEHLTHRFAEGFECFRSPGRVAGLLALSLVIWGTNAISILLLSRGFAFQQMMTIPQSFVLIVVVAIFILVPAAPGYWGLLEAGVIFGIVIMGIHENDALTLSYAVMLHLTQWVPIVLIGLPWAWRSHISLEDAQAAEEEAESL